MLKVKALLITLLVLTLAVSLVGCGLIASRSTGPDETEPGGREGELPEWLLLAHRSVEGAGVNDDPLLPKEREEEEEADEAEEEADEVAAEPDPEPAPAPAPAPAPEPEPTAPDNSDEISPSDKLKIDQANKRLKEIENQYSSASRDEQAELTKEYEQIRRALKQEYNIDYPDNLNGRSVGEWWDQSGSSGPSFFHESN